MNKCKQIKYNKHDLLNEKNYHYNKEYPINMFIKEIKNKAKNINTEIKKSKKKS